MGMQDTRDRVGEKIALLITDFTAAGADEELIAAPIDGMRLLITRIIARVKSDLADTVVLKGGSIQVWPTWNIAASTTDGWDDINLLLAVGENFNGTWGDAAGVEFRIHFAEVGPKHKPRNR